MARFSARLATRTTATVIRARSLWRSRSATAEISSPPPVYSSETAVWGEITSIHTPNSFVTAKPVPLLGNMLYWPLDNDNIIQFDLDKNSLDLIEVPSTEEIIIMLTVDGHLGFASVNRFSLHFWSRVASIDGVVSWTHHRVIDLEKLLAPEVVAACMDQVWPVGYAEDANVIFIHVHPRTYMIHLKSMQIETDQLVHLSLHKFLHSRTRNHHWWWR